MAMTARLWSISALAVELCMDRRTVAARLSTVPADGQLNGKPAWRLTTALAALQGRKRAPAQNAPEEPRPPLLQGMLISHNATIYCLPRWVAQTAVECGLGMSTAYELADAVTHAAMRGTRDFFGDYSLPWVAPSGRSQIYDEDCLAEIDWLALAAKAGEPDWRPPRFSSAWPERLAGSDGSGE
jgi:hypothetical protein